MNTAYLTPPTPPADPADASLIDTSSETAHADPPDSLWLGAAAVAAAALAACGGGAEDAASDTSGSSAPASRSLAAVSPAGAAAVARTAFAGGKAGPLGQSRSYAMPASNNDASRFLQQAQFHASDSDIALVNSLGYAGFLAQQFDVVPVTTAWAWLNQQGYGAIDANKFHFTPYQFDFAVWWQIFNAPDTVRKRIALALSEIFVVSANTIDGYWPSHLMANWWDMLSSCALGTFRALLEKVTLHPAMGMYLNTRGSQKETAAGREPDENYAREVMQLMTIGLVNLNPDGTPVLSNGVPVDSFGQSDVSNLARVFTGYDLNMAGNVVTSYAGLPVNSTMFTRLPMALNASLHSTTEVNFLGTNIPAGTDGDTARKIALDALANHPNVGPFIGSQLIQRLVTSNPSPAYVARVSAVFADNGSGVRGDIAATVAAILLDDEARSPDGLTSPSFGRLREPMLRFAQWGRTFGLTSARGTWKVYDQSGQTQLNQSPLRSSSVFNFFRPGYVPPGTGIAAAGLVAPEFQIVNESTVSAYLNWLLTMVRNGMYVGAPNLPQIANNGSDGFDLAATYVNELPLAADASALVARLNLLMTAGQLSVATVTLIVNNLNATPVAATSSKDIKLNRIAAALLLIMASPEYLVQK